MLAGQVQKEFLVNEAHALIDFLLHPAIEAVASDPPADAADGAGWIVGPVATGEWAGREGKLAFCRSSSWAFYEPQSGMQVYNKSLKQFQLFDHEWTAPDAPAEPSGGTTIDNESRAAISALILALRSNGIFRDAS